MVSVWAAGCDGSDGSEDAFGFAGDASAVSSPGPILGGGDAAAGGPMPGMTVMTGGMGGLAGQGAPDAGATGGGSTGGNFGPGVPAMDGGPNAWPEAGQGLPDAGDAALALGDGGTDASRDAAADAGNDAQAMAPGEDECGPIPTTLPSGQASARRTSGSGGIEYDVKVPNEFTRLRTTLLTPAEPPPSGTVFLWPGLQPLPSGKNFQPIGNGVLQPVLTWGPSCSPSSPRNVYDQWWIAPMYVNITSRDPTYAGCKGGPYITAEPGDLLELDMVFDAPKWGQKVLNLSTQKSAEFSIDMAGQQQARAFFDIELPGRAKPTEDIVFTHTVLSMAQPDPSACEPLVKGARDYASKPRVSADGKHCCIDRIVLRAAGVTATTMDP